MKKTLAVTAEAILLLRSRIVIPLIACALTQGHERAAIRTRIFGLLLRDDDVGKHICAISLGMLRKPMVRALQLRKMKASQQRAVLHSLSQRLTLEIDVMIDSLAPESERIEESHEQNSA
jgi:hypothetical protein